MSPAVNSEADLPLQCVYRWEKERADRIFLTQPLDAKHVREWTWAQAADEVRRMAAWLEDQPWERGSHIAILSKNCAWWIMADLAIWMAGHVTIPVYPSLTAKSVRQILEHSESKACFLGAIDEKEAACFGVPSGVRCIRFPTAIAGDHVTWDEIVGSTAPLDGTPLRAADDLATIIYTSGTTGLPKGVMHNFGAMRFIAKTAAELLGLTEQERVLSYLPLAHIVERMGVEMTAFVLGSHIFFSAGIETFLEDLARARSTIFLSVPRLLLKFQQGVYASIPKKKLDTLLRIPLVSFYVGRKIRHKLGLDTVHHAASGAAPLPVDILQWYRRLGLNLAEGYGMTETLITHLPKTGTVRPGYVGNAFPGVEQKLGESNELLIRSPMNMVGYYKDPEGTREAFTEDGFFRTGDICEIAEDGQLKIIGRIKEQFKTSKGKYVAPAPIENRLAADPLVESCCLMGAGLPSPFALVLLTEEARRKCAEPDARHAMEESLRSQLEEVNRHLDGHERVAFLAIANGPWTVSNGLITPTLKIKRAALEDRYQRFIDDWKAQNKPVVWEQSALVEAGTPRERVSRD